MDCSFPGGSGAISLHSSVAPRGAVPEAMKKAWESKGNKFPSQFKTRPLEFEFALALGHEFLQRRMLSLREDPSCAKRQARCSSADQGSSRRAEQARQDRRMLPRRS